VGPTVLKGGVNNCIRFSAFNEMKHLYQEYKGASAGDMSIQGSGSSLPWCRHPMPPTADVIDNSRIPGGAGAGAATGGGGGGGEGEDDGPALNAAESMLLGAVAGGLSAVATHPIDTVKSNMQALGGGAYVAVVVYVYVYVHVCVDILFCMACVWSESRVSVPCLPLLAIHPPRSTDRSIN
jgi:hypothetical protein